jgi:hypothetical protein
MARNCKDLGARKHARVGLHKPGFLIPAPRFVSAEELREGVSPAGAADPKLRSRRA